MKHIPDLFSRSAQSSALAKLVPVFRHPQHAGWRKPFALACALGAGLLALGSRSYAQTLNFEAESLTAVGTGASTSVQSDSNSSGGKWIELEANSVGDTVDYTLPNVPAGTYQISMMWKGNNNRGILNFKVDGVQLGGTLDQYSSNQTYPTTNFGTMTFASTGNHTVRLTTTGKNSSSGQYYLSADRFTLVAQGSGGQVDAPTFSPAPGNYTTSQSVTISSTTPGATIHYTTDGSTPTATTGTVYSGPVTVSTSETLKAIASKSGLLDSIVATGSYSITTGGGTPNGHPILPPKWAFGVLFGSYQNQSQTLTTMNNLRNGYCGDLIWIDSSWLSSDYNGPASAYINFKFDSSQFPDPAGMISTLHGNHFHFGVWEWSWIDKSNSLYNTGASKHYFIEDSSGKVVDGGGWHGVTFTGQFDLSTSPSVTWWKSLNQPLFQMGFDFLKMDTTVGIPSGGKLANGSTSSTDWKGFYHKAAYEATTTANLSQGRGLILAHSDAGAATNNDQYPGLWTGDSSATWSSFVSKDMGGGFKCNTKTSGAYWCGDTGGYNNDPTDELYQRWTEYGCFTPLTEFFGAKGSKTRFPWVFNSQSQAIFKKYTQLRYRLLPFRYSNAQICYHETPVKYPVWWPNNKQIINGNGDSQILVQPITSAGATSASVALPSGSNWISYWTGTVYSGGSTPTIPAPIDQVPMLIKAGSIIPMGPVMQYVDQLPADPLTLDTYPAGSTSYTLYEDDGISTDYQGSGFATTTFSSNNTSGHEVFSIGATSGSFSGQLSSRTYILKINQQSSSPANVTRDGSAMAQVSSQTAFDAASTGWYYDAAAKVVWVKFALSSSAGTTVSL